VQDGVVTLDLDGSSANISTLSSGEWHHIALTALPSGVRVFVNGSETSSGILAFADIADFQAVSPGFVVVGSRQTASDAIQPFNGALSGLNFWTRELDASSVASLARGAAAQFAQLSWETATAVASDNAQYYPAFSNQRYLHIARHGAVILHGDFPVIPDVVLYSLASYSYVFDNSQCAQYPVCADGTAGDDCFDAGTHGDEDVLPVSDSHVALFRRRFGSAVPFLGWNAASRAYVTSEFTDLVSATSRFANCGATLYTQDDAVLACSRDASCTAIHDWGCDDVNWRVCTSIVESASGNSCVRTRLAEGFALPATSGLVYTQAPQLFVPQSGVYVDNRAQAGFELQPHTFRFYPLIGGNDYANYCSAGAESEADYSLAVTGVTSKSFSLYTRFLPDAAAVTDTQMQIIWESGSEAVGVSLAIAYGLNLIETDGDGNARAAGSDFTIGLSLYSFTVPCDSLLSLCVCVF
jgi:hypothetical protein